MIELLSSLHIPAINCLPVKKRFGALTQLMLPPIHEDSSLPYTGTATLDLLKNIGKCMYIMGRILAVGACMSVCVGVLIGTCVF